MSGSPHLSAVYRSRWLAARFLGLGWREKGRLMFFSERRIESVLCETKMEPVTRMIKARKTARRVEVDKRGGGIGGLRVEAKKEGRRRRNG